MTGSELLTVEQMGRADKLAMDGGTSGLQLMERAGRAVADAAASLSGGRPVHILCGPGNNGGDGYVAARYLKNRGFNVTLSALGDPSDLKGDAKTNFDRWTGETAALDPNAVQPDTLIIDALFGAGLARPLEGVVAATLAQVIELDLDSVAVDLPSGINGDTGEVMGIALHATETVTFFRKKPGHVLFPGREHCGPVTVADIGIPEAVLEKIEPTASENEPDLWLNEAFGALSSTAHKYNRGHLVVFGGEHMTGASRLSSRGGRRVGAGLVTLAVPESAWPVYATGDPGTIVEVSHDAAAALDDPRRNAVVIGPGLGVNLKTRDMVRTVLLTERHATVLDADALTSFENAPGLLFTMIQGPTVMTPHEGEFGRLFQFGGDKVSRARSAAELSGATIVLKGADTVIADPSGEVAVNTNAPPWLGTAGSGDVLSGMIGGFLAMGAEPFEAAAAAVWCHGEAANVFGPGMVAEDIPEMLPEVIDQLLLSA